MGLEDLLMLLLNLLVPEPQAYLSQLLSNFFVWHPCARIELPTEFVVTLMLHKLITCDCSIFVSGRRTTPTLPYKEPGRQGVMPVSPTKPTRGQQKVVL